MAISVNDLKIAVESLSKKSQNGYLSSNDYNSDLQQANLLIYEYYYKIFELEERIVDALNPFLVEVTLPLTQGARSATTPFPANFFHRVECSVNKVTNQDCGEQPLVQTINCDYLLSNEVSYTLSSSIRRPSIKKNIYRHTYINNIIHVFPKETQNLILKYLRKPNQPVWASTPTSTPNGDIEIYNPGASVQVEFPEQEFNNFVDILLFSLGIQLRENAILNFVKMKQQENLVK